MIHDTKARPGSTPVSAPRAEHERVTTLRVDHPHGDQARLATLPLTIFERYMLVADEPEYPMTFLVTARFSGRLDVAAFAKALRTVVAREPLLSSIVINDDRGRPCWTNAGERSPWLDVQPLGTPCEYPQTAHIDLRCEPGLRCWVRYDRERAEIRLQFHHACCDGLGTALFMEDLLRIYHRQVDPASVVEPRALDAQSLVVRERVKLPWLKRLQCLAGQALGLSMCWLYLLRQPQRWACPSTQRATPVDLRALPDFPVQILSAESIQLLKRVARDEHVTFNELLLSELFLTLDDWQQQHAIEKSTGLLRVLVPMTLRTSEHRQLPAANVVSIALIDRGQFLLRKQKHLRWSLHTELTWMRRTFAGHSFLTALRCFDASGWLQKIARPNHCDATLCFTNIGRVGVRSPLLDRDGTIRAGELRLESVHSASPIRRQTPLMITAMQYRNALHFAVNYDRRTTTQDTASNFLTAFMTRLEQRAATVVGDSPDHS